MRRSPKLSRWPLRTTTGPSPNAGGPFYRRAFPITTKELAAAAPKDEPRQDFVAMAAPIRRLVAQCKAMPFGKERSAVAEQLGKLLKQQDALLRIVTVPKRQRWLFKIV